MALFQYKAIGAQGELLDGRMEAASASEVAARLQALGHVPVEAKPANASRNGFDFAALFTSRPFTGDALLRFTQQLATLLGSGQPLDRALGILLELPEDEKSKRLIGDLRDAVRGGASLSSALERQHGVFSKLYLNLVRAGEAGGNLHDTLQRLAEYLERSQALRGRVINALVYPVILLAVVTLALLFLMGYVVPQFATMYESLNVTLPWFSRGVLWVGEFVRHWWFALVAVPCVVLLGFERRRREPQFRIALDDWLLRQKFVGRLLAKLDTARMARTLGTLLKNGVPLLSALGLAKNVLGNVALANELERAAGEVKNGQSLSASLAKGGKFPRLALQMIQVGEESGTLDVMLLKTADAFEADTAQTLDRLLSALTPAITLILASVVGVIVVAVLVPLYDLTGAIN